MDIPRSNKIKFSIGNEGENKMDWNKLYDKCNPPQFNSIGEFVNNKLWEDLNSFLQNTYNIHPELSYSQCSMKPGWNVKYKKCGRSLCTLYPIEGSFIALVIVGRKEVNDTELILPLLSECTQKLYKNTSLFSGSRWLMINVNDLEILNDILTLIQIRAKSK